MLKYEVKKDFLILIGIRRSGGLAESGRIPWFYMSFLSLFSCDLVMPLSRDVCCWPLSLAMVILTSDQTLTKYSSCRKKT